MYGNIIRENKGLHQSTSTIYEFMHQGRLEKEEEKKCQCGTSSTSDENPTIIQLGGSGQERVFKIKLL